MGWSQSLTTTLSDIHTILVFGQPVDSLIIRYFYATLKPLDWRIFDSTAFNSSMETRQVTNPGNEQLSKNSNEVVYDTRNVSLGYN